MTTDRALAAQMPSTALSRDLSSRPALADEQIAATVARLMAHYWTEAMPTSLRRALAEDWLADLREFGPAIVASACTEWRRRPGGRRPTPGDIRAICIELQRAQETRAALSDRPHQITDDEARDRAEAFARKAGFPSLAAFQLAGHSLTVSLGCGKVLRFPAGE